MNIKSTNYLSRLYSSDKFSGILRISTNYSGRGKVKNFVPLRDNQSKDADCGTGYRNVLKHL